MINYESLIKESLQNDSIENPCLMGINNMGWNCYINSVLQVLASDILLIESFINFSKEDQAIINLIVKYDLRISNNNDEVIKKIKRMISTGKNDESEDLPKRELDLLKYLESHFLNIFVYIHLRDVLLDLFKERNKTLNPYKLIEL